MRGLYAIVDPDACQPPFADPVRLAEAILAGGCAVMQLRAKRLDDAQYVALATAISARCRKAGALFIVNDRVHLVQPLDADGVHIGQSDMPPTMARERIGSKILGVSTHNAAQAVKAAKQGADWVALGPVYETQSKVDAEPAIGLSTLRTLCEQLTAPVIAIGGIDHATANQVITAGASMIAVISALARSAEPSVAAAQLQGLFVPRPHSA